MKLSREVKNADAPVPPPSQGGRSRYTCADYREEMRLMGLQRRLEAGGVGDEERRRLEAEIKELLRKMEMD